MRHHLQQMYGGVSVSHSFEMGNQVFDCVPIYSQLGVRLQGLKNIATPPPFPPYVARFAPQTGVPTPQVTENASDKPDIFGNKERCETGTIALRRLTFDELSRFATLRQFFQKSLFDHRKNSITPPSTNNHAYAHAVQNVSNWGGYGVLNLWSPSVNILTQTFSLSQEWYVGGTGKNIQTAETGWQNYPWKYFSESSRLFIYWTADDYNKTGCYNLDCAAFVQTNNTWILGGAFSNYSTLSCCRF
ncbi:MAG: neprosin family prolyl endopeptidase [Rhizomicrobium sp.]